MTRSQRLRAFRVEHAKTEATLFFGFGFLFDILTLDRIDNWLTLVQQAIYLIALGWLLMLERRFGEGAPPPPYLTRVWQFREPAIHFLFGSLLSSYALFYFKSASGLTAIAFVAIVFVLLLANELPQFRRLGPVIRFALMSFSITSYFAYLLPVIFGFLSPWLFAAAVIIASIIIYAFFRAAWKVSGDPWTAALQVWIPGTLIQALLLALFILRAIPPVPLSVSFMGVYHGVERQGRHFKVLYETSDWRFWRRGDQDFAARPGDRIYAFARIFAPARFADRVQIRWSYRDARGQWQTSDAIPFNIAGGRDDGFGGYAFKQHYQPGDWRVHVETLDGREIAYLPFTVRIDNGTEPRVFIAELR